MRFLFRPVPRLPTPASGNSNRRNPFRHHRLLIHPAVSDGLVDLRLLPAKPDSARPRMASKRLAASPPLRMTPRTGQSIRPPERGSRHPLLDTIRHFDFGILLIPQTDAAQTPGCEMRMVRLQPVRSQQVRPDQAVLRCCIEPLGSNLPVLQVHLPRRRLFLRPRRPLGKSQCYLLHCRNAEMDRLEPYRLHPMDQYSLRWR